VEEPPQEGGVFPFQFHHVGDVFPGDHQKMYRRLGIQVMESQEFPVFVDLFAGDFALYDFAKNTVRHGGSVAREKGEGQRTLEKGYV
jgi:hypothetical protein